MISKFLSALFRHIDSVLLACVLFAMLVGLLVLYSASGQEFSRVSAQMINMSVALVAMWVVANISPQHIERIAIPAYIIGVLLLIAVALFGDISHGARRWLNIGITKIQPSELLKLASPIMLAWYFSKRESNLTAIDFLIAAVLLAVPVLLIMKQPDLGTAMLVTASGFYVIFFAGLSWRFILGGIALVGALSPVFWSLLH
ncbi:MAG: FtsW/RodA/SpoVE family cell cycle protein, partial [Methylotenera sp.]|nr:FtsW/RodA/SpoVE family cell cycle protein [Methylotenera sp.]